MGSNSTRAFSRVISLTTKANFSDLINEVKKVKEIAKTKGASASDLFNIDASITKMEELQLKIKQAVSKGFANPKEAQNYERMLRQMLNYADDMKSKFSHINLKGLQKQIDNIKKDINSVNEENKKTLNNIENQVKTWSKNVSGASNYAKEVKKAVEESKNLSEVQQKINSQLDEQIRKAKITKETSLSSYNIRKTSFNNVTETGWAEMQNRFSSALLNGRNIGIDELIKDTGITLKDKSKLQSKRQAILNPEELKNIQDAEQRLDELKVKIDELTQRKEELNRMFQTGFGGLVEQFQKDELTVEQFNEKLAETTVQLMAASDTEPEWIGSLSAETDKAAGDVNHLTEELENTTTAQIQFDSLTDSISNFATRILSVTSAWYAFRRVINSTYEDVKNLDKAFGSIAMVTEYSVADLWEQYDTYAELANKLGQSTQGVIEASSLYYQQGLKTNEVMSLTEETMKLATLAGLDFKEATSQMTGALRAFKLEMTDGAHVTDVYAELAAHAAATVNDISQAMSATAAIAHSAGMEYETTAAMLTTMIEATQEAPKNLGTALKAVIARFTELKENVSDLDEVDLEGADFNKVDKALKSVGVQLKDTTGQFRNLDDVFRELAAKWDTLDRNSQRYIATIAAGSRQQSRFIALMENSARTEELIETAYNSAGKSSEQFAKYQDTVEYKVTQLKNTWEQLRTSVLKSDFFKGLIESANNFINRFKGIDFKKILIATPIAIIAGRKMAESWIEGFRKGGNTIGSAITKIFKSIKNDFKTTVEIEADISEAQKRIEQLKAQLATNRGKWSLLDQNALQELYNAKVKVDELTQSETINTEELSRAQQKLEQLKQQYKDKGAEAYLASLKTINGLTQEEKLVEENQRKLANAQVYRGIGSAIGQSLATGISMGLIGNFSLEEILMTTATTSGVSALSSLMAGQWQRALGQAAVAVGAWGLAELKKYIDKRKEAQKVENDAVYRTSKELEKLKEKQERLNQALDETNKKYDEQKEHYDDFSKATDTYKELTKEIVLTEEEQEELNSATQTLIDMHPELVEGYDSMGNAVINLGEKWDDVIAKEKEAWQIMQEEQIKAQLNATSADYQVALKEAEKTSELYNQYKNLPKQKTAAGWVETSDYVETAAKFYFSGNPFTMPIAFGKTIYDYFNNDKDVEAALGASTFDIKDILKEKDLEKQGEMLQEWAEENEDYQNLLVFTIEQITGENYSTYQEAIKALDQENERDEFEEKFRGYLSSNGLEKLKEDTDRKLEKENLIIKTQKNNVENSIKTNMDILLQTNESYQKLSEQEQKIITDILSNKISTNKYLELDDESKRNNLIYDLVVSTTSKNLQEELSNLSWEQKQALNNFYDALYNDNTEAAENYYQQLKESGISLEFSEYIRNQYREFSLAYEELTNKIGQLFVGEGKNLNLFNWENTPLYSQLKNMGYKSAQNFVDGWASYNLSPQQSQIALKWLDEMLNEIEISGDELSYLTGTIDWSSLDITDLDSAKQGFIEYAKEMGDTEENVETIWNRWIRYIKQANIGDITKRALSIDGLSETITEKMGKLVGEKGNLSSVIQAQLVNGFLSFSELQSFKQACENIGLDASKYISYGVNGEIILNTEKLKDSIKDQALSAEEIVAQEKARYQELINQKEAEISLLKSLIDEGYALNDIVTLSGQEAENLWSAAEAAILWSDGWEAYSLVVDEHKNKTIEFAGNITDLSERLKNAEAEYKDLIKKQKELSVDSPDIQALSSESLAGVSEVLTKIIDGEKEAAEQLSKTEQAWKNYTDAVKDAAKAQDDYYKKLKDTIQKEKEYQESLYGTKNYNSPLDGLYNYDTAIDLNKENLEDLKNQIENVKSSDDVPNLIKTYMTETHTGVSLKAGENDVLKQALANEEELMKPYQKYWKKVGDQYVVYIEDLMQAQMSDKEKDFVANQLKKMQDQSKLIKSNNKDIKQLQQDFEKYQEEAVQKRIDLEKEVVSTLKEQYQNEIDNLKNKYDAIKDADDDYLDSLQEAIQKERDLRNRQNEWDDLATKEKKLSLMQRDTSGVNQLEVQKLQQEVEQDRTKLLDDTIDDVVNGLKEIYELQQESRDAEIEYRESLLTDANLIKEATDIIASWQSSADAVKWFMEAKDLNALSTAELEQLTKSVEDSYNTMVLYEELAKQDFEEYLTATNEDIEQIHNIFTETTTTEMKRALDEIKDEIAEDQQKALEAWQESLSALAEAKQAWIDADKAAQSAYEYWQKLNNELSYAEEQRKLRETEQALKNADKAINWWFDTFSNKNTNESKYTNPYYTPGNRQANTAVNMDVTGWENSHATSTRHISTEEKESGTTTYEKAVTHTNPLSTFSGKIASLYANQKMSLLEGDDYIEVTSDALEKFGLGINSYNEIQKELFERYKLHSAYDEGHNLLYVSKERFSKSWGDVKRYASGGLVNYTGPAWVDGSPSRPEAFLSADDTEMIGSLVDLLQELTFTNRSFSNMQMSTVGDTTIELTVNFDSVSEDYDTDRVIELMQQKIVEAANYTGSNVILHKR